MIAEKTPKAFGYANKAANAYIFIYSNNTVIGFCYRQGRTPFCAVAALVTNLNFIIIPILYYANGTPFLVGYFEKSF